MKKILIFLFIGINFSAYTQDFDNYKAVKASDRIPQDLISLSSDIYEKERKDISQKDKRFVKKAKDDFFLESSFGIHDMLYSGKIIFNDPLTKYVEKVAKEVFKSESSLNQKIQIFVMKSTEVNAFATNNGMIFITMGLLAQLENEAQLAFILSHEFTHYKKKHVMTGYVETVKIKKGKTNYKKMNLESKIEAKFKFSKDQETEADIDGLEMYLKTNYSLKVLNGVFDVLEYEYLPFDDIAFDKTFFNSKNFIIPKEYFLENTRNISEPTEIEDNADAKSTHPSIYKRRKYIAEKIVKQENKNKTMFIVSESDFKNIRKIARFELSQLFLNDQDYIKSLYNSYLLLKETPNSIYLKKNIGKCLYSLSKYKNSEKLSKFEYPISDSVEGSSQNVYFLLEKLTSSELNTLSIKYLWNLKKEYPKDIEIQLMVEDIIKDGIYNDIIKKSDYSTVVKAEVAITLKKEMEIVDTTKTLSKYDKIKKSQKIQKIQETSDTSKTFAFYSLVEELNEPEFLKIFDNALAEKIKNDDSNLTNKQKSDKRRAERILKLEKSKKILKNGEALAIDKIVFINPHYAKLDEREEKNLQHLESEEAQLVLNDYIKELAPKVGLQIEMIDDIGLKAEEVEKFNDFGYLRQWFNERSNHIDNDVNIVSLDKNNLDYLINKYQTKYFCWTGIIGEREAESFKIGYILAGIYLYPLLPYMIYLSVKPEYQTIFYSIVFDMETGKTIYSKVESMDYKDNASLKRAHLYDMLYQMKQKTN